MVREFCSARLQNGSVSSVEITSEAGTAPRVIIPWKNGTRITTDGGRSFTDEVVFETETKKGEKFILKPA